MRGEARDIQMENARRKFEKHSSAINRSEQARIRNSR